MPDEDFKRTYLESIRDEPPDHALSKFTADLHDPTQNLYAGLRYLLNFIEQEKPISAFRLKQIKDDPEAVIELRGHEAMRVLLQALTRHAGHTRDLVDTLLEYDMLRYDDEDTDDPPE